MPFLPAAFAAARFVAPHALRAGVVAGRTAIRVAPKALPVIRANALPLAINASQSIVKRKLVPRQIEGVITDTIIDTFLFGRR